MAGHSSGSPRSQAKRAERGRGGGIRTPDHLFWRQALYQLSYAPINQKTRPLGESFKTTQSHQRLFAG